ncbi:MAG: hypothetical protein ACOZIN_10030 [Myxococcota bacterium]
MGSTRKERQAAEARLRIALELFEAGVDMMRQNLRRRFPTESDAQIEGRLSAWLRERPGAEYGDAEGRRVDWQRTVAGSRRPSHKSRVSSTRSGNRTR